MSESNAQASRREFLEIISKHKGLREFLMQSNAAIFAHAEKQDPKTQKLLLDLWAADRATYAVNQSSDIWRSLKGFSHGLVNSTFIGMFGNQLKASIYSRKWDIPYDAALAYFNAIDSALAKDEPWLSNIGLGAGVVAQIVLPAAAIASRASAATTLATNGGKLTLKELAQQSGSTLLVGPIHLVPQAATRGGNILRFCAAESLTYGAAGAFLNRDDKYKAVDGAVDGGLLGGFIGCGIGTIAPKRVLNR